MIALIRTNCLDASYQNSVLFDNVDMQVNWFGNRIKMYIQDNSYIKQGSSIKVEEKFDNLVDIDYLYYVNQIDHKTYYCFVTDIEYINEYTTLIHTQVDFLQTYLFDFEIAESFVERLHTDRWYRDKDYGLQPILNLENDGFEVGELEEVERQRLYTDKNKTCILSTTTPIGKLKDNSLPDTGSGGDDTNDTVGGAFSFKDYVRFVKGFEGFAKNVYRDSGGVKTIGYGITANDADYNKLVSSAPISEKDATLSLIKSLEYNKKLVIQNGFAKLGCTTENQLLALTDICYNTGRLPYMTDSKLMNAIRRNPTDYNYLKPIWENYYIYDDAGNRLDGLIARRKEEFKIYKGEQPIYRSIGTIGSNGSVNGTLEGNGYLP